MATENNQLGARVFVPQYKKILASVFNAQSAFGGAFAPIQLTDGISRNTLAFTVKTSATPVVIGEYATGVNDGGFGTGAGLEDRFGELKEIKYIDTDVPYTYTLAINEGLDRHTINNDLNAAVADRLVLQAQAQVRAMNVRNGQFLADNAGIVKNLADYSDANVVALFNELSKEYVNAEVTAPVSGYVNADLYNTLVDLALNTSAKNSSVSIDENNVVKFKGFKIFEVADKYLAGTAGLFAPDAVVAPFVGIETTRTQESEHFDGVKLQAAAKGGSFILDDNKKAVAKITATPIAG